MIYYRVYSNTFFAWGDGTGKGVLVDVVEDIGEPIVIENLRVGDGVSMSYYTDNSGALGRIYYKYVNCISDL